MPTLLQNKSIEKTIDSIARIQLWMKWSNTHSTSPHLSPQSKSNSCKYSSIPQLHSLTIHLHKGMAPNTFLLLAIVLSYLLCVHAGTLTSQQTTRSLMEPCQKLFSGHSETPSVVLHPQTSPSLWREQARSSSMHSLARLCLCSSQRFAPNGINGPHTHPRSSGLLLVLQGWLEVGFVDWENRLFSQVIEAGDILCSLKGWRTSKWTETQSTPLLLLPCFGSSSPGTVVIQKALFDSGMDTDVLAISSKVDAETIKKLHWNVTLCSSVCSQFDLLVCEACWIIWQLSVVPCYGYWLWWLSIIYTFQMLLSVLYAFGILWDLYVHKWYPELKYYECVT